MIKSLYYILFLFISANAYSADGMIISSSVDSSNLSFNLRVPSERLIIPRTFNNTIISICDELRSRSSTRLSPSSTLIKSWSRTLNIPEGKFQEVARFIESPDLSTGLTGHEYCISTLDRSVNLDVMSRVNAGSSGLVPSAQDSRIKKSKDETQALHTQCLAEALDASCPPHLRARGGQLFNSENSQNILNLTSITEGITFNNFRNRAFQKSVNTFGGGLSPNLSLGIPSSSDRPAFDGEYTSVEAQMCACNIKLIEDSPASRFQVMTEKPKIGRAIIDRLQKKFLNDYSQNREDVTFFLNHRGNILSNRGNNEISNDDILCKNHQDFEKAAKEKCGNNQISDEERIRRQNLLFSKLPNGGSSLESHWNSFENSISTIKAGPDSKLPQRFHSTGFNRIAFDQVRNGLTQEAGARNLNQILTKLVQDPDFISYYRGYPQLDPSVVIFNYFSKLNLDENISKLSEIAAAGIPEVMNSSDRVKSFSKEPVRFMEFYINEVTAFSPELRIALSNDKIFEDILSKAESGNFNSKYNSFFDIVGENFPSSGEDSSNLIKDHHFANRCKTLKENFANAICANESLIVDDIDPKELRDFYHENMLSLNINDQHLAYMSCSNRHRFLASPIKLKLDVPTSSFVSRILEERKDFYEKVKDGVEENNPQMISHLSGLARAGEALSKAGPKKLVDENNHSLGIKSTGSTPTPGVWDFAGHDGTFKQIPVVSRNSNGSIITTKDNSSTTSVSSASRTPASLDSKIESTKIEQEKNSTETIADPSNFVKSTNPIQTFTPTATYQGNNSIASEPRREELKQSISNPSNSEDVNRFVSKVSDDQIEELTRLRDQANRDREKIAALTSDAQTARIKALEDQIRSLETQRTEVISQAPEVKPTAEQKALVPSSEFVVSRQTLAEANRLPASNPDLNGDGVVSKSEINNTVQNGSGASRSALGSSTQNLGNENNALGSGNSSSADIASTPLVITSTVVKSGSPDLSLEVLRFLETEPDLQALTQIKDKGLVYRFKVIRDGQEKLEEVIIQFNLLSAEAKEKVEAKIATRRSQIPDLVRIEDELAAVQRRHSYEALRFIIGREAKSKL